MNVVFSCVSDTIKSLIDVMSDKALKKLKSTDEIAYGQLLHHITAQNAKRIILFALVFILIEFIWGIIGIVSLLNNTNSNALLIIVTSFLAMLVCVTFVFLILKALNKGRNKEKLNSLINFFWAFFIIAVSPLVFSDLSMYRFSYIYFIALIVLFFVPLIKMKYAIIYSVFHLCVMLVFSVVFSLNFGNYIIFFLCSAVFFGVSVIRYNSYCLLWFSQKRLAEVNFRCRQLSERDELTGMLNKNGLITKLKKMYKDSGENGKLAAILIDVDDFKNYNQIYGFEESDKCLSKVCNCIRIIAKIKTDIISRFDGDEFLIVLRTESEYDAVALAEQIRLSVETMGIEFDDRIITVTVGVSVKRCFGEDYATLINDAKSSLANAKKGGKNCIGYMEKVFRN